MSNKGEDKGDVEQDEELMLYFGQQINIATNNGANVLIAYDESLNRNLGLVVSEASHKSLAKAVKDRGYLYVRDDNRTTLVWS